MCCVLVIGVATRTGRSTKASENDGDGGPVQSQPISVNVHAGLKLEIVSVKHWGDYLVVVTMKNGFEKDITAVCASAENHSFRTDYITAEVEAFQKLAPGASDQFSYSLTDAAGEPREILVSAVVFSDGTSKGNKSLIAGVLDKREGMRIQFNRIYPFVERLGKVKSPEIRAEFEKVKNIAEALSCDSTDGEPMSPDVKYGLIDIDGRAFILSDLSKLETALANDRVETFYEDDTLKTVRHTGEEDFRNFLPRVERYFKRLSGKQ